MINGMQKLLSCYRLAAENSFLRQLKAAYLPMPAAALRSQTQIDQDYFTRNQRLKPTVEGQIQYWTDKSTGLACETFRAKCSVTRAKLTLYGCRLGLAAGILGAELFLSVTCISLLIFSSHVVLGCFFAFILMPAYNFQKGYSEQLDAAVEDLKSLEHAKAFVESQLQHWQNLQDNSLSPVTTPDGDNHFTPDELQLPPPSNSHFIAEVFTAKNLRKGLQTVSAFLPANPLPYAQGAKTPQTVSAEKSNEMIETLTALYPRKKPRPVTSFTTSPTTSPPLPPIQTPLMQGKATF